MYEKKNQIKSLPSTSPWKKATLNSTIRSWRTVPGRKSQHVNSGEKAFMPYKAGKITKEDNKHLLNS